MNYVCITLINSESRGEFVIGDFITEKHRTEAIDAAIIKYANNWKLERMASVERNILRLAIYEMFYATEPLTANIIINEAIEISKIFGNDFSLYRFSYQ